jgi:serine/threonine protein kinase
MTLWIYGILFLITFSIASDDIEFFDSKFKYFTEPLSSDGAFAFIHKAEALEDFNGLTKGENFALKIPKRLSLISSTLIKREIEFYEEMKNIVDYEKYIPKYYGSIILDDMPCIMMELGTDNKEVVSYGLWKQNYNNKTPDWNELKSAKEELKESLEFLHKLGWAHVDFRSVNVIQFELSEKDSTHTDRPFRWKLIDFGSVWKYEEAMSKDMTNFYQVFEEIN